jgi:two-component system, OmpR family, sensor kinase
VPRSLRAVRSLRVRVPATAIAVFAVSLAVATLLAFQLLLQAGRNDVDVVLDRERERFELAMQALLVEEEATLRVETDDDVDLGVALERAARRYLELNPSTESYWTLIRLDSLSVPLASSNGPDLLEPLFPDRLPEGTVGMRETIETEAGAVRSSSAPIVLGGEQRGAYQILAPLAPIRAEAFQAAGLVAAAAGVSLLLGAALLTATLWRSLSPLRTLASTARTTGLRNLHARVPEPPTDDEVGVLAREFNSMLHRLERASESQTEFMASISHELRTPITIARGHLELLRTIGRDDPAALAETVEVVEDELGRMSRLVEDLMAIARSEMEGFVRPRDLELVAFFEDLEVKLAGLKVPGVRIQPPPPVTLQADPDRLAQAVLNLVSNAHLHTPVGTRIDVRATEIPPTPDRGGEVVIEVADDGPGIPESIRDDVFAPFVRASAAPTSTGLGLAVVRAVVDAHGGEIELHTDVDGTRFALRLPHAGAPAGELSPPAPHPPAVPT